MIVMAEQALLTAPGRAGRPAADQPVPWHGARALPAGPWRSGREWMRRGACTAPQVDPDWFTVDEDAPDAAEQIAQAKAVCRRCPVRLLCRIHADETGEYGIYAAETYSERTRRLRRWRRLELPA
jgi:WhiB family transcriptional regulator, redox-sensing transcriptional regulator